MIIFEPSDCLYWTQMMFPNTILINLDANIPNIPINAGLNLPDEIIHLEDNLQEEAFLNYIFSNRSLFTAFMNIIDLLYSGIDVTIITKPDSLLGDLLSSIISHRYGYRSTIINVPEDVMPLLSYTEEEKGSFSLLGLRNLDLDKERYAYILMENKLQKAGVTNAGVDFI